MAAMCSDLDLFPGSEKSIIDTHFVRSRQDREELRDAARIGLARCDGAAAAIIQGGLAAGQ